MKFFSMFNAGLIDLILVYKDGLVMEFEKSYIS